MANIVEIVLKVTNQADKPIADFSRKMESLGKSLTSVGTTMSTYVTAPIVAGFGFAVKAASDLNESINKTKVVFGDAADEVLRFSDNAALGLGMSRQQAIDAAGTFGNLFTSMGIGTEVSADMSTSLLTLAADLASFNNIDPTVALEKLRAGLVGEVEPLRTLGVNLSAAAVEAKALQMGLVKDGEELTASAKAQAAYALILEQTTNAQGDFNRTSDDLANSTRILKAQFADVTAELGTQLLPIALQVVTGLRDLMTSFNDLSPAMQQTIVIGAAVAAALGPVLIVVGQIVTAVGAITPVVTAVAAVITGPLVAGIAACVAVVAAWIYTWKSMYEDMLIIWNWVSSTFGPLWEAFAGVIGALVNVALTAMAGIWQNVVYPALMAAWEAVAQRLTPAFTVISSFLNATFGPTIQRIGDWIMNKVVPAFSSLASWIQVVVNWLEQVRRQLSALKLPPWMTPGSPTPWEIGLVGVADALKTLSKTELPRLEASMKIAEPTAAASITTGARGGGGNTSNNYYNLTINDAGSRGNVVGDFTLMRALAGA